MPRWTEESTKSFLRNRWMILIAGIWIECCAGASYGFGIYSEDLKANFGYNQQDVEIISFFKDVGECVGIVSGLMYERFPPWVVLLTGALQNHVGYLMIWLSVTNKISRPAFWQMCLYICMAINSQTYLTTASVVTSVRNFPANRGIVIGLMKGCIGLSDAILTRIWRAMPLRRGMNHGGSSFILVISLIPTIVAILFMPVVRMTDEKDHRREKSVTSKFVFVSVPIVFLAIFLMVSALATGVEPGTDRVLGLVVILILVSSFGALWWNTEPEFSRFSSFTEQLEEPFVSNTEQRVIAISAVAENRTEADIESNTDRWSEVGKGKSVAEDGLKECDTAVLQKPQQGPLIQSQNPQPDVSSRSPLCRIFMAPDFFLLLFSSAMALGAGFAAINNLGQVASSQNYTGHSIHTFISMISIWQFLGRFGAGAFSDYVFNRWVIPRPLLITVASAFLSFSYMLIATSLPGTLYLGSILIGFCFGALYSLVPTITSDLFELEHFATVYNVVLMGNPVVSYILSVWVAGYLYDRNTEIQGQTPLNWLRPPRECKGSGCFELTFFIMGGVGLLATFGFVLMWRRSKKLYECATCNM